MKQKVLTCGHLRLLCLANAVAVVRIVHLIVVCLNDCTTAHPLVACVDANPDFVVVRLVRVSAPNLIPIRNVREV